MDGHILYYCIEKQILNYYSSKVNLKASLSHLF